MAQELGVDYLTISQEDLGALGDISLRGTLGNTVVETGFYVAATTTSRATDPAS